MPEIRISITLPYALRLQVGEYRTAPGGEPVQIGSPASEELATKTVASAVFRWDQTIDPEAEGRSRVSNADRLLRRTNRLLRWYRAAQREADVTELTRAQASPISFEDVENPSRRLDPLIYEEPPTAQVDSSAEEVSAAVAAGLATGNDPAVDVLFLLDAERAIQQGRFREAVLFCWSTIDSVFSRKYDRLVDAALAEEWGEARAFFKGLDIGLRNKMSAGMKFVAGRSLFSEPGDFWPAMSASYAKRNSIIHRGENATEDQARNAIRIAGRVVAITDSISLAAVSAIEA